MNFLQQLEHAPKNVVLYFLGLIGSMLDDYTLITLTILCVILGFILNAILIPVAVFFGGYYLMRLVDHLARAISYHAGAVAQAGQQEAQSNMQIAAALAQLNQVKGTVVDGDTLP